jgi:hypothetical protein
MKLSGMKNPPLELLVKKNQSVCTYVRLPNKPVIETPALLTE